MKVLKCPRGHAEMKSRKIIKTISFRGMDISCEVEAMVCPECGLEAGTLQSAGAIQRHLAEGYRKRAKLLTGHEIKTLRAKKGWSQQALADCLQVGVASIKRWETGLIQSKGMDKTLRLHLEGKAGKDDFSGNRPFSIPRIKLVIKRFEQKLGWVLLKKTDRMLYAAKYLWYADMVAFRDLGAGMTGAGYAALPLGPQINNYRDLVEAIQKADVKQADPLSPEEEGIIEKIIRAFPSARQVFEAAHREAIWEEKPIGSAIPYSEASKISEI